MPRDSAHTKLRSLRAFLRCTTRLPLRAFRCYWYLHLGSGDEVGNGGSACSADALAYNLLEQERGRCLPFSHPKMSSQLIIMELIFCALFLILFVGYRLFGSRKLALPPGPRGYPVVGNALDLPKENDYLVYSEWQKTYGA